MSQLPGRFRSPPSHRAAEAAPPKSATVRPSSGHIFEQVDDQHQTGRDRRSRSARGGRPRFKWFSGFCFYLASRHPKSACRLVERLLPPAVVVAGSESGNTTFNKISIVSIPSGNFCRGKNTRRLPSRCLCRLKPRQSTMSSPRTSSATTSNLSRRPRGSRLSMSRRRCRGRSHHATGTCDGLSPLPPRSR